MSLFDKIKETAFQVAAVAADTAEKAAAAGKSAADTAVKQTKTAASMGKVKLAIASEEDKLKKAYTELGRLFFRDYQAQAEAEMEEYQPWCDRCAEAVAQIAALNEQLAQLKAELSAKKEPEVVDADEVYEAEGSDEEFEIADEDISIFADFENAEIVDPVEDVTECVHFEEVPQEEAASDATEAPTVGTLYLDVTGEE